MIGRAFSVHAAAHEHGERTALVIHGDAWTYGRLSRHVAGAQGWLEERFGDRSPRPLAFVGERRLESLLVTYAALELGWTLVPLHARWSDAEKQRLLSSLGLESWISSAEIPAPESFLGLRPKSESHSDGALAPPRRGSIPADRLLAIVPTSGSSGTPKGVALSYGAFHSSAAASAERLGWQDGDRWLLSLPLAHVGGLSILTRCLAGRRTVVLPPTGESFDAGAVLKRLDEDRITHLSVVPAMLRRLLDHQSTPPTDLRRLLVGGAPLPPTWLAEARRHGWTALATYGLTEACSQVATQPPSDLELAKSTSGAPRAGAPLLDGFEARIDPDGVLHLRGSSLFSGYLPRAETSALDEQGWLRTGDLAKIEDGRLHILGRHDQMIITGGENVHPAEVERALLELPEIDVACVVGVPHGTWGQAVAAAVTPADVSPFEIEAKLDQKLARFKKPRRWLVLDALPCTASGKVDRAAVTGLFQD